MRHREEAGHASRRLRGEGLRQRRLAAAAPSATSEQGAAPRRSRRTERRGVVTLLCVFLLVLFILLAALVLDWAYLVLVQRDMQRRSDLVALAAAPALLDEDLIHDAAGPVVPDQTDDVADAEQTAHQFRLRNNAVAATRLGLAENDLTLTPGFVADVHAPRDGAFFDATGELPVPSPAYNSLRVDAFRSAQGANPVGRMIRGFWNAGPVDLGSGSIATLDNLLVGFRPTVATNAPVVPLAISRSAWDGERIGNVDLNETRDIELRLASPDDDVEAASPANAALVSFDGPLAPTTALGQVTAGIGFDDLPATGELGPATPSVPLPLAGAQGGFSASYASLLAARFNQLADAGQPGWRVFPLYGAGSSAPQFNIVGFVAARVIQAEVRDDRLTVHVEPVYLIETTAWTASPASALAPERNPYIHKLRLSR